VKLVAVGSIVALTALNCIGVRPGAITQNVLTLLKIGLVTALIVVGFALPGGSVANFRPFWPEAGVGRLLGPFGVAMVAVLWAYDGWIEACYVGGEVKAPERTLPRALVLSTLITIVLFCLVTASYTYVLSPARMALSPRVAASAAEVTLGAKGAALVAATILISTLGANNGIVLTAARVPYAMARDGILPRPYRTWGYPVTPLVFIAFAAWLVGNTIVEKPADSGVGAALILAGLPIYLLGRRAPLG